MKSLIHALATLAVAATLAGAQGSPGTTQREAIDKLAWLEGEWRGVAWMMTGPDTRHTADQWEKVSRAAGGTVLAIQGIGKARDAGAETGMTVHDAFAVLYWDGSRNQYTVRSFVATGHTLEAKAEVGDRRLVWSFEHPQAGLTRYTITLTPAGEWREVGEASRDRGATWYQFMEMTLKKQ
jgi:hypothetical protein